MIDKKACPIMTRWKTNMVECLEEKCMAWKPTVPEEKRQGKSWESLIEYIAITKGYPHYLAEAYVNDHAEGRCKLIDDIP